MALRLTTPEQHSYRDPTVDLDEKLLARRLESLPVLDIIASLQQVLQELQPLNEQQLDTQQRLRLLSVYRSNVRRLYDTAAPLQLRKLPLSAPQRGQAVDGMEVLCLAMADGFKIVIKEMHADPQLSRKIDLFGRVIRWATIQLGVALLHSYRYYRPQPPTVFLELHQLYALARHHGVHKQLYDDEDSALKASLATIYQALCLLAVTDPFSAAEGEVDRRFSTLLQYAPGARIVPGNSWQDVPEGIFFIDLESDAAPRHCVFLESPVTAQAAFLLDAQAALQDMHKVLAGLRPDQLRQRPEVTILRQLLPEVTPRDKRRSARRSDGRRWIEVVHGLESTHRLLLDCQAGKASEGVRWRIQDAGDTGYRLAMDESAASGLQVGDLICLVSDSDTEKKRFQLLLVRWIRDERRKGTELGVELLEGVPKPVRLFAGEAVDSSGSIALFLPSGAGRGSAARLVTPPQVYAEQRPLTIFVGEREVPVRCGRLVEQTAGFDCFEFTSAG